MIRACDAESSRLTFKFVFPTIITPLSINWTRHQTGSSDSVKHTFWITGALRARALAKATLPIVVGRPVSVTSVLKQSCTLNDGPQRIDDRPYFHDNRDTMQLTSQDAQLPLFVKHQRSCQEHLTGSHRQHCPDAFSTLIVSFYLLQDLADELMAGQLILLHQAL